MDYVGMVAFIKSSFITEDSIITKDFRLVTVSYSYFW